MKIVPRFCSSTLLLFCIFLAVASAQAAVAPTGLWKTIDDESGRVKSIVEIWVEDGMLFGKVVEILHSEMGPNPKCVKCPDDFKDKPIEGLTIMWDLKPDGNTWSKGKIIDPKKGAIYSCKIWPEGDRLKVRGYVFGLFFRTQYWHRVK